MLLKISWNKKARNKNLSIPCYESCLRYFYSNSHFVMHSSMACNIKELNCSDWILAAQIFVNVQVLLSVTRQRACYLYRTEDRYLFDKTIAEYYNLLVLGWITHSSFNWVIELLPIGGPSVVSDIISFHCSLFLSAEFSFFLTRLNDCLFRGSSGKILSCLSSSSRISVDFGQFQLQVSYAQKSIENDTDIDSYRWVIVITDSFS